MAIRDIELFHGVVFTKLLRSDRPINLKLFEFNSDKSSAAYIVNDEVVLYVKHSKTPKSRQRKNYACAWIFNFSPNHLKEIQGFSKDKHVHMVLVCGDESLKNARDMQVCFLYPMEAAVCIDKNATSTQSITVANVDKGKLRVWGTKNSSSNPLLIEKYRLESWDVPGN
jgi:hypothetical protein